MMMKTVDVIAERKSRGRGGELQWRGDYAAHAGGCAYEGEGEDWMRKWGTEPTGRRFWGKNRSGANGT